MEIPVNNGGLLRLSPKPKAAPASRFDSCWHNQLSGRRTMRFARVVSHVAVLVVLFASGMAQAEEKDDAKPVRYLALGDSVAFGFITQAGFEYINPDNFVGYPEYVGNMLRFDTVNAACPGEATSGFLSFAGADNGCRAFRTNFPLHVPYTSTQLAFAANFLKTHREVRLVTIDLGANDVFLLQNACASAANPQQCFSAGLPQALATIGSNMQTVLADLRATGFQGVIAVVNYYSLDYSDAAGTALTQLLNQAIGAPAAAYGAVIADVFTAFQTVASNALAGGKTCRAGLLNASPQNQFLCDVHPSQSGQKLMAQTIARAYATAGGPDDDR
jgi:lysophospholipase L1-like esterase